MVSRLYRLLSISTGKEYVEPLSSAAKGHFVAVLKALILLGSFLGATHTACANPCLYGDTPLYSGNAADTFDCQAKINSWASGSLDGVLCPIKWGQPDWSLDIYGSYVRASIKYYWNGNYCDVLGVFYGKLHNAVSCWANSTLQPNGTCQCKAGWKRKGNKCVAPPKDLGSDCNKRAPSLQKSNPINVGNGNKYQAETDYTDSGPSRIGFIRYYNSSSLVSNANLGAHWRSNFDRSIIVSSDPTALIMNRPDGKSFVFRQAGGVWSSDADVDGNFDQIGDGWRYINERDEIETYDAAGKLTSLVNPSGLQLLLAYDTSGRLITVADHVGRSLTFTYDTNGRIATMTNPGGGIYIYAYATDGNLASVTYPDGATRQYLYNEPAYTSGASLPSALTGLIDENGVRYATWFYDVQGRAISSEHGVGVEKTTVDYTVAVDEYGNGSSVVTDANGTARAVNFQTILGVARNTGESQPGGSGCGPASSAVTYDANGNVASRTDFNGNKTTYTYDLARNLETSRTEGLTSAGATTPQTRTITTAWHSSFRLPISVTEPGRVTSYSYDDRGNLTQKSIRDTATNAMRTWSWSYTYSSLVPGLVVQKIEDGPRTDVNDVTTTDYYDADAYCDGGHNGCRGQVSQVTNALGHVTRITRYNAHGQPEEIIDPNSLVTTLAYDARQRLVARMAGSERTDYEYDPAGQLVRTTRPDGSSLDYSYDAAHRLVGIADSLGNNISYTLDAMGNRVKEDVRDPSGQLAQTRSHEFDALNRLYKDIGAAGQATTYAYDAQGNLKQTTDPLTHSTISNYDALDRLIRTTDPAGGQVQNAYDALDRVTRVTDPKGVATTYTYNGLGDLLSEVSADRGTTTYTYDSAGNLLTRTDARGVTHATRYDELNRPIARVHTAPKGTPATPDITWQYDTGPNGIGRMTSMSDETGSTVFSYDTHGRLLQKVQSVDPSKGGRMQSQSLSYEYDSAGHLARQTYPSAAQVDFAYNSDGRPLEIRVNGQVLVSDIVFQPFGAPKAWTWGNGTPYTRQFDADGRLDQYPVGGETRSLGFDAAGRIVNFSHGNPVFNRYYEYDPAGRLTKELDNIGVSLWTYDLNGNRTSSQAGSAVYGYAYPSASNRLASVSGPTPKAYVYDAAGNIVSNGTTSFTYNAAGRLAESETKGKGRRRFNTYRHNALGQRVIKDGAYVDNGPVFFLYDEAGRLVGEYDKNNALKQETVWLDNLPIAVLKPDPSGQMQAYAIHADHLGTPRAIVDGQNRVVWRWLGSAFGQGLPEEDPDGDGVLFEYNLRFPGQYYDKETNLHYNYFRDYDPGTGRYVQSDPIGLEGGMNTYIYVEANPLQFTDPRGLDNVGCTTEPLTIDGRCKRICCAIHDKCYDDNKCTAASWTSDKGCNAEACDKCNKNVVKCFLWCDQAEPMGIKPAPGTPEYYCPAQHRYIKIPGDFPTVEAAKAVCGS